MTYDPTMRSKPHVERREREARGRRDTFAKIFEGEDGADGAVSKARDRHDVGGRGLAAATSELALDLIHHHRRRLGLVAKGGQPAKESTMNRTEELRAIAKAGGIVAVAKAIVDENRSYGISEHEFVELATEHAKAAHPELSGAQAFSKMYEIPEIWRACAVLKSMPFVADIEPLVVGGVDAMNEANDDTERSEAYQQLLQIGRDRWPSTTEAQAFAAAVADPVNAKLALKALKRPRATTSYQFPFPR